eukprot:7853715-Ditylum_brightwellii.AAC.1
MDDTVDKMPDMAKGRSKSPHTTPSANQHEWIVTDCDTESFHLETKIVHPITPWYDAYSLTCM